MKPQLAKEQVTKWNKQRTSGTLKAMKNLVLARASGPSACKQPGCESRATVGSGFPACCAMLARQVCGAALCAAILDSRPSQRSHACPKQRCSPTHRTPSHPTPPNPTTRPRPTPYMDNGLGAEAGGDVQPQLLLRHIQGRFQLLL